MLPLILKLKKKKHKEIARAQDIIVEELYKVFDRAVLHGGTSIWRCYDGNRFSEDVDVYLPKDVDKIEALFGAFKKTGFDIIKKKIGKNSIYSTLNFNREMVRFEAIFRQAEGILADYKTVEGSIITVYTLSAEDIIKEKVAAYLKRCKVRDLYDIFFLLRHVKNKEPLEKALQMLIKEFKMPADKKELRVLIFDGLTPEIDKMLEYIKQHA